MFLLSRNVEFQILASFIVVFDYFQASLHSIKSRYPNINSLRDFFIAKYQENSPSFKLAQVIIEGSLDDIGVHFYHFISGK